MESGDCLVMILEKANAVEEWRRVLNKIRQDYQGPETYENVVHGSDSDKSAHREIALFFGLNAYMTGG